MRSVLIYRERILPQSETFIKAQADALTTFRPTFVGLRRVHPSLPLNYESLILSDGNKAVARAASCLYRLTAVAPKFHQKLKGVGASLVHAHFAPDGTQALTLSRKLRLPLVVTLHGYDVTVKQDFKKNYSDLWREASMFFCVSDHIRRQAIQAGFPENKLRVHYIGIDCSDFSPSDSTRDPGTVLFVGRLTEKKGVEYLIRAMRQVQDKLPSARLQVIGDGPLRQDLTRLAAESRINCEFLGPQPGAFVRQLLSRSMLLCAPSVTAHNGDTEGLPTVLLEAQAMGIPVVSTLHAGVPEAVIHRETGLLVPERDTDKLAESILRYLSDNELNRRSGLLGAYRVRTHFDIRQQTQLLESMYREVISERQTIAA